MRARSRPHTIRGPDSPPTARSPGRRRVPRRPQRPLRRPRPLRCPPPPPPRSATRLSLRSKRFKHFVEIFGRLSASNPAICSSSHRHVVLYRSKTKGKRGKVVAKHLTNRRGRYAFTEAFPKFRFWH